MNEKTTGVAGKRLEKARVCDICGETVKFSQKKKHFQEMHPEVKFYMKSGNLFCGVCNIRVPSWKLLLSHINESHGPVPTKSDKGSHMAFLAVHCDACGETVKSGQKPDHFIAKHPEIKFRMGESGQILCTTCDPEKAKGSWGRMVKHYAKKHGIYASGISPVVPTLFSLESSTLPENIGELVLEALLKRVEDAQGVVSSLRDALKEASSRLTNQNQLNEEVGYLKEQLAKAVEEKERVVKIHNEEVEKKKLGRITPQRIKKALFGD